MTRVVTTVLLAAILLVSSDLRADMDSVAVTKASQERDHIDLFAVRAVNDAGGFVGVTILVSKARRASLYLARLNLADGDKQGLWVSIAPQDQENGDVLYGFTVLPELLSKCTVSLFFKEARSQNGTIYGIDVKSYLMERK